MTSEEYSRQLQEKFELYLLALVFTLLGLAVQTSKFGSSNLADISELLAWIALILSGVVGLSRMEWIPVAHKNYGAMTKQQIERDALIQQAKDGVEEYPVIDQVEPVSIQQIIDNRNESISQIDTFLQRIELSTRRKFKFHKWTFILGIILLAFARGYPAVDSLIQRNLTNRSTWTLPPPAASTTSHLDSSSPSNAPQSAPPVNSSR